MGIGSAALALGSAALPAAVHPRGPAGSCSARCCSPRRSPTPAPARSSASFVALAVLGCGIGPTLVSQYSLAAQLSPAGRSATTMTMLGSAVVVGQAVASAVTGAVVDRLGSGTALALPAVAAALVVAAGIAHRHPPAQPTEPERELVAA